MKELEQYTKLVAANQVDYDTLLPLYYSFKFNDILFECQLLNHENGSSYILNLTADLGFLPYSSENINRRNALLKKLGQLMAQGTITIDHHCAMKFPLSTVIESELSAKTVMETILYTLLDSQELLRVITDIIETSNKPVRRKRRA